MTKMSDSVDELLQETLAAKRVRLFLQSRDVDYLSESSEDGEFTQTTNGNLHINASVTWHTSSSSDSINSAIFRLRDLDIIFPQGEMTLVAGKVGSGKTLLLLALLGEARLLEGKISYATSQLIDPAQPRVGTVRVEGGVAYVPQTAWLQSCSIRWAPLIIRELTCRDNILFGLPFDVGRYRQVLFAAGLLPDLAILDDSDLTQIGERYVVIVNVSTVLAHGSQGQNPFWRPKSSR